MRFWHATFLGLSAAAAGLPRPTAAQGTTLAFVHVNVVPMDRERVLPDQVVIVRDGRIAALGPAGKVTVPAGATQIDGRGRFLIPGLADMHAHLPQTGPDTVSADDLLFVLVANGITTVRDMHSGGNAPPDKAAAQRWLVDLRRQVDAGERLGPRIYMAGDPDKSSPAAAAQSVAALKGSGHDFVKLYGWPSPVYDSIVAAAGRVGLRVVGHVPRDVGLERVLRDRWASIEHLWPYLEAMLDSTGRWSIGTSGLIGYDGAAYRDTAAWMRPDYRLDPARLRALAQATRQAGVWNCPTLWIDEWVQEQMIRWGARGTAAEFAQQEARIQVMRRWTGLKLQILRALEDAGAGLLVGSDFGYGQAIFPGFSIHRELAALTQPGGLTPYQALTAATRSAAAFLGTLDSAGTVAVGKRADLVLLSGNPLDDIRNVAGPAGVMVAGRWLPRREIDARLDAFPQSDTSAAAGAWGAGPFYAWVRESRLRLWQR